MKVPAPPPPFEELLKDLNPARVAAILSRADSTAMSGEYLSWDTLRYKTPPDGLTVEEWWLQTRWARRSAQRVLPQLLDL
ncbi:MAG: Fic family protein, partial [Actinomycetia bacterium]|nr:Fic family protein [Actinomycetes bacterium]